MSDSGNSRQELSKTPAERYTFDDLHAPILREQERPSDGHEPMPMKLVFFCMALLAWGGWYLGEYNGGFSAESFVPKPILTPTTGAAETERKPERQASLEDRGKIVYRSCLPCHQASGTGLPGSFPPLAGSERVVGSAPVLARILLHGLRGPTTVKGRTYNGLMPAWGAQLSDEDIAAVLTYIRGQWGNRAEAVSPNLIASVRQETSGRNRPFSDDELDELENN